MFEEISWIEAQVPASLAQWQALEVKLGFVLPATYRDLLLKHNGGRPESNFFSIPESLFSPEWGDEILEITSFIPIEQLAEVWVHLDDVGLESMSLFPIATCADERLVCIDFGPTDHGAVHGFDVDNGTLRLADSLPAFLAQLQTIPWAE